MTDEEALTLIRFAAAFEPRFKTGDDLVERARAWAFVLPDVTLQEALEAARMHYATTTAMLMPAHIMQQLRRVETDPAFQQQRAAWLAQHGITEQQLAAMTSDELQALIERG